MIDAKVYTLLKAYECGSFVAASRQLNITQPAVSQHIKALENELGVTLFERGNGRLTLTKQGVEVVKYAKKLVGIYAALLQEIRDGETLTTHLTVGVTHTAESNPIAEALAGYCAENQRVNIKMITDTINNLYSMLRTYEIDIAIVDGAVANSRFSSTLLDTDYLMCILSNSHPLAKQEVITLTELKKQKMILRTPASATRMLFESALESNNVSVGDFNITLEVDNIATIKDLIRKNLGVSILPRSACLDELKKGKLTARPIENLSMVRETRILYNRDFTHTDTLSGIIRSYRSLEM